MVATPYIVHKLGVNAYGVLSIVSVVMGYFAVLDLGLGAATIKYIADYYYRKDFISISKVIGTSIVIYSCLGIFGAVLIAGVAGFITTKVIHVPQNLYEITQLVFYISSFGFLVNMPLTVFNSIPNALQRFDILVKRNIVLGTTNVIGQVVLLSMGFLLKEIVVLNVGISIIGIVVFVIVSKRLLPEVSFKPKVDIIIMKQLFRFSTFIVILNICCQIVWQTDRLLIAMFLPIASVTYYVVPLNLVQKMLSLISNITTAVFPAVSEYKDDQQQLKQLYLRAAKIVLMLLLPVALVLFTMADKILGFWMGSDFAAQSSTVLQVLTVGFLLGSFSAAPGIFAMGLGKPEIPAFFAIISAILNLLFALIFIPRFGIVGAGMALIGNCILQVPMFIHTVNRKVLHVTSWELISRSYLRPLFASIFVLPFYLLCRGYVTNFVGLIVIAVLGSMLYLTLYVLTGGIDLADKVMLRNWYSTIKSKFRLVNARRIP